MKDQHTLPGDLPGLLRRGAPVMLMHRVGVVVEDPLGCTSVLVVVEAGEDDESEPAAMSCISLSRLALDLTDPTGRLHAVVWRDERASKAPKPPGWAPVVYRVRRLLPLTDSEMAVLMTGLRAAAEAT